jgi:hypothetical protein
MGEKIDAYIITSTNSEKKIPVFFLLFLWGHYWPIVPAPDDR